MDTHPQIPVPIEAPRANDAEATTDHNGVQITHFDFTHRVFQAPGSRFVLNGLSKIPTFRVEMGDLEGVVDISVLRKEFNIDPSSHDGKLLDLVVAGLRYVPDIRPRDEIPSELLTGKASWTIAAKHKQLAEQRLQIQLLSWVSGKEVLITEPGEIELFLGQIENREKLRTAFKEAAVALGFGADQTEMVMKQLELLAREVCYIEALRDRFVLIQRINGKLTELGKSYGNDRNGKLELARVQSLLQVGIAEYQAIFKEADAQTGEIIGALKAVDRQVKYIRHIRDDLHFLLMQWEPHIRQLPAWRPHRTPETDRALSGLYRFLAPRYSSGKSLLKKRLEAEKARQEHAQKQKAAKAGNAASKVTSRKNDTCLVKGEATCQ